MFSKIAPATIGIMFLGTPHRGLDLIYFIRFYGRIFAAFGLATLSPMTHDLKLGSEYLQDLSARFRQVLKRFPIKLYSFHETRRFKIARRLVILSYARFPRLFILSSRRSLISRRRLLAGLRRSSYPWKQIIEISAGSMVRMM